MATMKHGKDYEKYDFATARKVLEKEGFTPKFDEDGMEGVQNFTHTTLYHFVNKATTQRATISVKVKTSVATISYAMLASQHCKRRTREQINRDNFVLYD